MIKRYGVGLQGGFITDNGHWVKWEDVKALQEENARLKDIKESFENTKRLQEKSRAYINNPQDAWIYKTCCDVLRKFDEASR